MQTSSRITDDNNRRNAQPAEHKPKLLDQVRQAISASTQNQALSAILFLYQPVLDKPPEWVNPAKQTEGEATQHS